MSDLVAIADRVVAAAAPGEQVEAFVARGGETEVRVYEGRIEHYVSAQSEGIGVRVIRDGRTGFAYAGVLDSPEEVLAEARSNVEFGTVDEWAGLAVDDGVQIASLELWDDALEACSPDDKIALALELERLSTGFDRRVRVDDANYADMYAESAVVTTTGIRRMGRENGCYVSVSTLADDDGETQTGFGFSVGRRPDELDIERAAREASQRATRLLGAVKPASGRLTVVMDPLVTAQFLSIIASTLNGEAVVKGRSLFRDRLGEQIAAPNFSLTDDPTDARAYSAAEVDGEGLATRRNELIVDGVLQRFVHSSYSARRAGATSTANAVRGGFASTPGVGALALQPVPGTRQPAEIIAGIDHGLLVQSVSGIHSGVNVISGDFSTGAAGLMISDGELASPVREFTIASTLQRMLADIVEVGADLEWLPMRSAGVTLVIDDITLSGA
jgi:PmbA protein